MSRNRMPYYKAYPRDFIEGTIGLSFEVKCAYRVLLDMIYMQSGRLPDDAGYICGVLGCSKRKWASIREALIHAGKIVAENGIISNFRATFEIESLSKLQDKNAENAPKAHKNKPLKKVSSSQPEPDTDTYLDTNVSKQETRAKRADLFDEFWREWPNKVGKPKAATAYQGAIKRGASHERIMDGLRRYVRDKPPDRPWLNPATFLNQERYHDEPANTQPRRNGNGKAGASIADMFEDFGGDERAPRLADMGAGSGVIDFSKGDDGRYVAGGN